MFKGAANMDIIGEDAPPPGSTDVEGWRRAISAGRLRTFRLESLVAVFQDLDPTTDKEVRHAITKHLSDAVIGLLRKAVGPNHPNNGEDIIYRVHSDVFESLLKPASADGKALRVAFAARVNFRVKDAIALEYQHSRIPLTVPTEKREGENKKLQHEIAESLPPMMQRNSSTVREIVNSADGEGVADGNSNRDLSLLNGVRDLDEQIDVNRLLAKVPDHRKRLAFHLYMEDVPYKSKKGNSIAKALGVSDRTVQEWIKEVKEILRQETGEKS